MSKETILIEKTSKPLKLLNAATTWLIVGTIVWYFSAAFNGAAHDTIKHNADIAAWLIIAGVSMKIIAKTLIWWRHS